MVKKVESMIVKLSIQTSISISKKAWTKLSDSSDNDGIPISRRAGNIFLKELERKLGEEDFKILMNNIWHTIKLELNKKRLTNSKVVEEGIYETTD